MYAYASFGCGSNVLSRRCSAYDVPWAQPKPSKKQSPRIRRTQQFQRQSRLSKSAHTSQILNDERTSPQIFRKPTFAATGSIALVTSGIVMITVVEAPRWKRTRSQEENRIHANHRPAGLSTCAINLARNGRRVGDRSSRRISEKRPPSSVRRSCASCWPWRLSCGKLKGNQYREKNSCGASPLIPRSFSLFSKPGKAVPERLSAPNHSTSARSPLYGRYRLRTMSLLQTDSMAIPALRQYSPSLVSLAITKYSMKSAAAGWVSCIALGTSNWTEWSHSK